MLSLFVYPGAGQIALGQKSKGIAIIVIFTLFLVWWGIWVVLGLINSYSIITDGIDQKASSIETGLRYLKLSFIPGIIAGGLYIYSAADAYIGNGQAKEQ